MRLQSITEIRPCLIVLSINSLFQNEVIERLTYGPMLQIDEASLFWT